MSLNYLKFTGIYVVAAVFVVVGTLIAVYPYHPITTIGWVVWFLIALPAYVTLEAIAGRLFRKKTGYRIDQSRAELSVRRIVFGFAIAVTAISAAMVIIVSAGVAGGTFWELNFSTDW